jgi:Zn-finger nucleic acid-binding protein
MQENNKICNRCESECEIEVVYSENEISFCPFCGEVYEELGED